MNELENTEDRRSVGRHGNQHVRLRFAQVDLQGDLPGSCGDAPIEPGSVPSLLVAIILSKIRVSFLLVWLADMAHQGLRLMHNCRPEPATAAATKSRAISASRSSQTGHAAAGFCYVVNRRGETLASNYRQSNADDGRVTAACQ